MEVTDGGTSVSFGRGDTESRPTSRAGTPGDAGAFDFAALQRALNDPTIKQMAEEIANDPDFLQVSQVLQRGFQGMMTGQNASKPKSQIAKEPSRYMTAMATMLEDPKFTETSEMLRKSVLEDDPNKDAMMENMRDPVYRSKVEQVIQGLYSDPELTTMMEELEKAGPMVMMKYWHNPEILSKLGSAMSGTFEFSRMNSEVEEPVGLESLHAAATAGHVEGIHLLLQAGDNVNHADEEGRTALHFAAGYGEIECARALIAGGASLNMVDANKNTALHYAAGYGQAQSILMLLECGADPSRLNADGKTALEVAQLNEFQDVVTALQEHGRQPSRG